MNGRKQRLELTWIGKDERPRLEPRILIEDLELSYHASVRRSEKDIFDNVLIQGDNLLALKALEQKFMSQVKCIYIDPPFNTGDAMEHYDDGVEHSIWLSLMRDRLEQLKNLLSQDGTLVVHIDDNELAYLIAVCDEIFGRSNRQYIVTFKQSSVSGPKAVNPGIVTIANYLVIYAKDKSQWRPNKVLRPLDRDTRYSKLIANFDDEFARWSLIGIREAFAQARGLSVSRLRDELGEDYEEALNEFVLENAARVVRTARVKDKDVNENARAALQRSRGTPNVVFRSERADRSDYYFLNGEQLLFYANKTRVIDGKNVAGEVLSNIWDDLLSNNLHNEGGVSFPKGKKPEALIKRILELTTAPGDLVLDSFAGSGTTGAVAHKMGRRWIMVELGEHCQTHIIPRMKSVINGEDKSGITEAVRWKGGGGFRYCRLAPSLLEKDAWGNWVISPQYNAAMLTEAVCKLMGFTYAPSEAHYWMHGRSSETDFIYVTTQSLTHEQLRAISEEVGDERSLLICCKAFRANLDAFPNLTVKKIPQIVLRKCEWGKDNYSLNVANLPLAEPAPDPEPTRPPVAAAPKRRKQAVPGPDDLFATEAGE
jgi:adenine-specific DNA-methyltransferase